MLRITVEEKRDHKRRRVCLILEGKLTGLWVKELEKTWNQVNEEPDAAIAIDLRAVDFMSQAGEDLLCHLHKKGANLIPHSLLTRAWVAEIRRAATVLLFAVLFTGIACGQQSLSIEQNSRLIASGVITEGSAQGLAFGRYIASLHARNPFTEIGPVALEIDASLPRLGSQGRMLAIRQTGDSERSEYRVIRIEGDPAVKRQVISRYLAAEDQAEALPYSSVAILPANYKFRYLGSPETPEAVLYRFQIAPKKKRAGLIRGEIWIDSATGIAVRETGRLVKQPSVFIRRVNVVRDTTLCNGVPTARVTHLNDRYPRDRTR